MKGFNIMVAHCNQCNDDFLYVPGKVNCVVNKNADTFGCPRCPTCNRYDTTRTIGRLKVLVYSVQKT